MHKAQLSHCYACFFSVCECIGIMHMYAFSRVCTEVLGVSNAPNVVHEQVAACLAIRQQVGVFVQASKSLGVIED